MIKLTHLTPRKQMKNKSYQSNLSGGIFTVHSEIFCTVLIFLLLFSSAPNKLLANSQNLASIQGIVLDSLSSQPLSNVNIQLLQNHKGTASDNSGEFILQNLKSMVDTLMVTHIGYEIYKQQITLNIGATQYFKILLKRKVILMPEVEISARRNPLRDELQYMEPGTHRLTKEYFNTMPVAIVPDLYRTLQSLPGVTPSNDLSPQFHVRGGNADQNLVLLDGAPMAYPFHFFGVVSSFNMDTIDDIYFSPGGFSARYGDRLSSVVDIQTVTPGKNFIQRINFSLIDADMTLGGQWRNKISWLISGRTSHFDTIERLTGTDMPYSLYDLLGKLTFDINSKNRLLILSYLARDTQKMDEKNDQPLYSNSGIAYINYKETSKRRFSFDNQLYSLRWDSEISSRLFFQSQLTQSRYTSHARTRYIDEFPTDLPDQFIEARDNAIKETEERNQESGTDVQNIFEEYQSRVTLNYELHPDFILSAGGQFSFFKSNYYWQRFADFDSDWGSFFFDYAPIDSFSFQKNFNLTNFFIENTWIIHSGIRLKSGLRFTRWNYVSKLSIEPRLNLDYNLNQKFQLKLAYGLYSQGIATALEGNLLSLLPLYFPLENQRGVEKAHHFIIGLNYGQLDKPFFSVVAYFKKFQGLLKSIETSPYFVNTPGTAWGIETELKTKVFRCPVQLNYCWSHSQRTYDGATYDTNFDIRHRFQASTAIKLSKNWLLTAYWDFHSGQPYSRRNSPMYYRFYYNGDRDGDFYRGYEVNLPRGIIRYPYYHRLDLCVSKNIVVKKFTFSPYFSVRNAYYRKNILYYERVGIEYDYDEETQTFLPPKISREFASLPIIPTIGFRMTF